MRRRLRKKWVGIWNSVEEFDEAYKVFLAGLHDPPSQVAIPPRDRGPAAAATSLITPREILDAANQLRLPDKGGWSDQEIGQIMKELRETLPLLFERRAERVDMNWFMTVCALQFVPGLNLTELIAVRDKYLERRGPEFELAFEKQFGPLLGEFPLLLRLRPRTTTARPA